MAVVKNRDEVLEFLSFELRFPNHEGPFLEGLERCAGHGTALIETEDEHATSSLAFSLINGIGSI